MAAPLTKEQRQDLARLYRAAYATAGAATDGLSLDDWRRSEVARACGKLGLRCCSQDDYCEVRAHAHGLLGQVDQAIYWRQRGLGQPQREAAAVLRRTCAQSGVREEYADRICRQAHRGIGLNQASARQLWVVVYAVRALAQKQRSAPRPAAARLSPTTGAPAAPAARQCRTCRGKLSAADLDECYYCRMSAGIGERPRPTAFGEYAGD